MRWISAHPVTAFITLTFLFSYLVGFPFQIAVQAGLITVAEPIQTYLSRLLVVMGPAVAALALDALLGRDRAASMWTRLWLGRTGLLAGACITMLGLAAGFGAIAWSGPYSGLIVNALLEHPGLFLTHLLFQTLMVGLCEEAGWRAWLFPALLHRMNRFRAATATGLVWGVWHLPVLIFNPAGAPLFIGAAMGLSVIFGAIWIHTGRSLFPVAVAHAVVNTPLFFLAQLHVLPPGALESAWQILQWAAIGIALTLLILRPGWWRAR
jgi:membrane protease YdiL (CAAX protease family)